MPMPKATWCEQFNKTAFLHKCRKYRKTSCAHPKKNTDLFGKLWGSIGNRDKPKFVRYKNNFINWYFHGFIFWYNSFPFNRLSWELIKMSLKFIEEKNSWDRLGGNEGETVFKIKS